MDPGWPVDLGYPGGWGGRIVLGAPVVWDRHVV